MLHFIVLRLTQNKKVMKKLIFLCVFLITSMMFLNCKKESSEKDILSFTVAGQVGESSINAGEATISVVVGLEVDLNNITPVITISSKASISPASGETVNFSSGQVIYNVTAEDGSKKQWSVSVTHELRNGANIISFGFDTLQVGDAIIDTINNSVIVTMEEGTDLSSLTPQITISDGATMVPTSGQTTDFTVDSVLYVVTAENGTQKEWYVKVTLEASSQRAILSISVPNQVGDDMIIGNSTLLEVPATTDLTAVAPTIIVSPGATITPASEVPQDFTVNGYVSYKVTAENGQIATYRVYVNYPSFKADNSNFQYVGRIDFTNPKLPRYWMSGVYIMAKFSGTYCDIIINDPYQNYIQIVVDGGEAQRLQNSAGISTIKTVTGLVDGEHTLLICKTTETGKGYMEFLGLRCDELLTPDPLPTLKMEFIGNSITCGAGSDQTIRPCGVGAYEDQHNIYDSYGPLVARSIGAQWHISSYSGIGLINSCCGISFDMTDVYQKINLAPSGADYDVSQYVPDVITVCLGQNDGVMDSAVFCSDYVSFIETLRGYYPDAQIVLLTSPMADPTLLAFMKSCLTGIVDYMNTNGDSKVYKFYYSQVYDNGCNYHPSIQEHQLMANELIPYINSILP
jgi:hypothetical protein